MDDFTTETPHDGGPTAAPAYRPPTITLLGDVADLTHDKTVGAADGATFLGLDIGTI